MRKLIGRWQYRSDEGYIETIEVRPDASYTRDRAYDNGDFTGEPVDGLTLSGGVQFNYRNDHVVEVLDDTMQITHYINGRFKIEYFVRVTDSPDQSTISRAVMTRPVPGFGVNSPFFDPTYPESQERQHIGVDLTAPFGTVVVSPVTGVIEQNFSHLAADSSFIIIRDRETNEYHVLAHITSDLLVGSQVESGQPVGVVSLLWASGRDQSHLHWGINTQPISTSAINGPGGLWGWGKAPKSATATQASDRGWLDPLTRLQQGDATPPPSAPSSVYGPAVVFTGGERLQRDQRCAGARSYWQCTLGVMEQLGASDQALAFARQLEAMGHQAWAGSFEELGPVDLVTVHYPLRANTNEGFVMVNAAGHIVEAESFAASDQEMSDHRLVVADAMGETPLGKIGYFGVTARDGGGQVFIFTDLLGTCRACEPTGWIRFGFDFDAAGRFLGTRLLEASHRSSPRRSPTARPR